MDIYSFVNSKTIQEHLRKIQYQFNSLETTWLIRQCWNLNYKQRKKYWQEVIDTMPDCEVPESGFFPKYCSLHELIKVYINVVDRNIKNFYKEEEPGKYVYTYAYYCPGDPDWCKEKTIYASLEECMQAYKSEWNERIVQCRIRKQSLENVDEVIEIEFRGDGEVERLNYGETLNKLEKEALQNEFSCFWFDFPTPFQKGDLLGSPDRYGKEKMSCFVLDKLSTWASPERKKDYSDDSDMCGYCYCLDPDNSIFYDSVLGYMDFEFYNGPYTLEEKSMLALSKFLKGEIEIDTLLNAHQRLTKRMEIEDSWLDSGQLKELQELGIE